MYLLITGLILIVSLLMILIVLVQNSKGGGLAAGFSSSNQIMGVRKTTDFLEKATWGLAAAILFLCVISAAFIPKGKVTNEEDGLNQKVEQAAATSAPAAAPTTGFGGAQKGDSAK